MDNLASLNIIPFLGLMNILEVKYLHIPEVYRTMLAILCDYNPLIQTNVIRTRRYLRILLAREPDLAQCLLNFIDEPQETTQTSANIQTSSGKSQTLGLPESQVSQPHSTHTVTPLPTRMPAETGLPQSRSPVQGGTFPQGSEKSDVETTETIDTMNCVTQASVKPADVSANDLQANASEVINSPSSGNNPPDTPKDVNCQDRIPHFVPVINIHHRGIFPPDSTIATTDATTQRQEVPLFLPRLLSSSFIPSTTPTSLEHTVSSLPADGNASAMSCEHRSTSVMNQHSEDYPLAKTNAVTVSAPSNERQNVKSGRKWKVAQTQTSAGDCITDSRLHETKTPKEALHTVTKFMNTPTASMSPAKPSASQSSMTTPSVCLSKLLGQPSVAYLPAGHFIDNRNCIVGGCKTLSVKPSCSPAVLSGKLSSAAAKLHLLSTQAGSEKSGSVQSRFGKAPPTIITKLGSLSMHAPSDRLGSSSTSVKLSSKSAGTCKIPAFSKILPGEKRDAVAAFAARQEGQKTDTVLSDKQVQVGQRQFKELGGKREPAHQVYTVSQPAAKDSPANQKECQNLQTNEEMSEVLSGNQNESEDLQVLQEEGENEHTAKEMLECQQFSAAKTDKPLQVIGKPTSGLLAASKKKVQVVEVSVGTTHSLSAFPYIQQMILPDGQVSSIAHNSPEEYSPSAAHQTETNGSKLKESIKTTSCCQLLTSTGDHEAIQERKLPSSTQTPKVTKSQVKLSVSIQTSSSKQNASGKKPMACPLSSPSPAESPSCPAEKAPMQSCTDNTEVAEDVESQPESHLAAEETHKQYSVHSTATASQGRGKRKRSIASCTRPAAKKCNKENSPI